MDGPDRPIWFAGDLGDPWVAAIAGAIPRPARRLDCPGDLPDPWPTDGPTPGVLVIHRASLNATDAQRLDRLRSRADAPDRVILCVGPHARFAELERWSKRVDVVLPESIALETLTRHVSGADRTRPTRSAVVVVASVRESREMLVEACRSGGFSAEPAVDWAEARPGVVAVWDVPVLEPDWPDRLADRSRLAPVVALIGLADRASVSLAREHGASACLDLPCDLIDLWLAIDRASAFRLDRAHGVPPRPKGSGPTAKTPRKGREEKKS